MKINENINEKLATLFKTKKVKQVASLYFAMLLSMALGIGVTVINTRLLGPEGYGDLKFLQNLFLFLISIITLGIFISGSRLLALKENESLKQYLIGTLIIFCVVISLIYGLFFYLFSFFEDKIFNNELGSIIRICSPLLFIYPFQLCLEKVLQGDNRIYELSIFRVIPQFLYIIIAISFDLLFHLTVTSALGLYLACFAVTIPIFLLRLRPKFENIKQNYSLIINETRNYGFHVYIGAVANVGTSYLAGLSIGYFLDNTNVGYFSLAVAITYPLSMVSALVGTALFKDFANQNAIPRKATIVTLALSAAALVVFLFVVEYLVLFLYSNKFSSVVQLSYLLAFGNIFRGFGDYINLFLGSHGRGKEIRNSAIANGISNLLGYGFLVYAFGIYGAAFTKLFSDLIYCLFLYVYYRKLISSKAKL